MTVIEKNCYFISHLGLGDNITMIGAVRYLTSFYKKIYVIVKDIYFENVALIYSDNPNIVLMKVKYNDEHPDIHNLIQKSDVNDDVFASGFHKKYLRITNEFLNLQKNVEKNKNYSFVYDFIKDFYSDINLDFQTYYDFFNIPENDKTHELYNKISDCKIVFVHTKSSNKEIDVNINDYIDNHEYIIICPNKNMYPNNNDKHDLANSYLNLYVAEFITIIKNANVIKVIDSCFSCILVPLMKNNKLKTNDIEIITR